MLHVITSTLDDLCSLIKDDPVRPEIPLAARIHDWAEIFVLVDQGQPLAVTCVRYTDSVPRSVADLSHTLQPTVAVFYTIWSYHPGSGRQRADWIAGS